MINSPIDIQLADLIKRDSEYIANIEVLDNGKTFNAALSDIEYGVAVLRYYAGWCDKIHGKTIPVGRL